MTDSTIANDSMQDVDDSSIPVLPRGVRLKQDKVRERTVLLGPERTVGLDPIAAAIAGTIDGNRSVGAIIDHLCAAYQAPREVIGKDVKQFLLEMANRRLLDIKA